MDLEKKGLTVRVAERQDAPALAHFLSIIDDQPLSTVEIQARLDAVQGFETTILASVGDQAIGFASLRVLHSLSAEHPGAELSELFVDKAFSGGEVERALIQGAESLAKQHGATHLGLHTGLRNTKAQGLYRTLGFQDYALAMRKMIIR